MLQDGDIGIGRFPEIEEVGIGNFGFCGVATHGIGASQFEMCKGAQWKIDYNTAMIEELLEFGEGIRPLMHLQVSLAAQERRIHASELKWRRCAQLIRRDCLQVLDRRVGLGLGQSNGGVNGREPIEFQHSIERIALFQFVDESFCPIRVPGAGFREGRDDFDVSARSQGQSGCGILFGGRPITEFRFA